MYHPDLALRLHNAELDRELRHSIRTRTPMHDRPGRQYKGLRRVGHWISLAGERLAHAPTSPAAGAERASVTIRPAQTADGRQIARLSELSERHVPTGNVLVAELDESIIAAMPVDGGFPIADPLRSTTDIVELLELRTRQLRLGNRQLADAA